MTIDSTANLPTKPKFIHSCNMQEPANCTNRNGGPVVSYIIQSGVHGEKPGAATFCRAADGTASRSPGSRCRPRPPLCANASTVHAAGSASGRVIIKADIALHPGRKPKDNPRFIVTNLTTTPKFIYQKVYCARGDIENRIKELKHGLEIDRTSCSSFKANQFRLLDDSRSLSC